MKVNNALWLSIIVSVKVFRVNFEITTCSSCKNFSCRWFNLPIPILCPICCKALPIDTLISKRMKSTALKLFHDDDYFINSIIERCPSRGCRLFKTRTAWGSDSFYLYMAKTINDSIFYFFAVGLKDFLFFVTVFSNFDSMRAAILQQSCLW